MEINNITQNEEKRYKVENIESLNNEKSGIKKDMAFHAFMAGLAAAGIIAMHKLNNVDINIIENVLAHTIIISFGGLEFTRLIESMCSLADIEEKEELLNSIKSLTKTEDIDRGKSL